MCDIKRKGCLDELDILSMDDEEMKTFYWLFQGDCLKILPKLKDESIDLIVTSPPYADLREVKINPDNYVDWFLPIGRELYRVLKPSGSFILNINDKRLNGERHLYVFKLVLKLKEDIGFKFIDTYIWRKTRFNPVAGISPLNPRNVVDVFEYCFWFTKTLNYKFFFDEGRREPKQPERYNYRVGHISTIDRRRKGKIRNIKLHEKGVVPINVLEFHPKQYQELHISQFPEKLPEFFIKINSEISDVVLDPFIGSGTTMKVCQDLKRSCIGIEINPEYCEIVKRRCFGRTFLDREVEYKFYC